MGAYCIGTPVTRVLAVKVVNFYILVVGKSRADFEEVILERQRLKLDLNFVCIHSTKFTSQRPKVRLHPQEWRNVCKQMFQGWS